MRRWAVMLGLALVAACSVDAGRDASADASLSGASLSDAPPLPVLVVGTPAVEIGEFEGGGPQTLDLVSDVLPLGEDRLLVVDRGAATLLVFGRGGERIGTVGRFGDGPGEFRLPGAALLRGDTLLVTDEADRTVSRIVVQDRPSEWSYLDETPGPEIHGDDRFPLDAMMSGRIIVEGVLDPATRARSVQIVSAIDFPIDRAGFRVARASDDGRLWVQEVAGSEVRPSRWVRLSADGDAVDAVELPARFDPLWVGEDQVLGRWRGEFDVHYVRAYELEPTDRTMAAPDWTLQQPDRAPRLTGEKRDSMYFALKMAAKDVATAQEVHYAEYGTYTTDLEAALPASDMMLPDGVEAYSLSADSRGHRVVLSAAGFDALCALAMGNMSFSGVYPGAIVCGDEDDSTRWDTPEFGAGKGAGKAADAGKGAY